jgi:Icc-related predicted phosphoesterase
MPLTMQEIQAIQTECWADDLEVDYERMASWSENELRSWFERGGDVEHLRERYLVSIGACLPNAPIPDVPPPPAADASGESGGSLSGECGDSPCVSDRLRTGSAAPGEGRVFCVSDLHTDHIDNLEWCRALRRQGGFDRDTLLVAGDICASPSILKETLELLAATFSRVFYVPGNHDLWIKSKVGLHIRKEPVHSIERLEEVLALCAQLGVSTRPGYASGAIVAPIFSWYHSSWDTEPDVVGWDGIPQAADLMMDFHMCKWPPPLATHDDSIARRFDAMNDAEGGLHAIEALVAAHPGAPLITLSHFVPRQELNPEKRFLFFPPLAKAVGSVHLAARIDALRPDVHVFGHTHFVSPTPPSRTGSRAGLLTYLHLLREQGPLRRPPPPRRWATRRSERAWLPACPVLAGMGRDARRRALPAGAARVPRRAGQAPRDGRHRPVPVRRAEAAAARVTRALGPWLGGRSPPSPPLSPSHTFSALLRYDAPSRTFAERYDAGWSNWYARYPRRADLNHLVAPYVAAQYRKVPGIGEVGWLRKGDNLQSDPRGDPTPAWALGPSSAVVHEKMHRRSGQRVTPGR